MNDIDFIKWKVGYADGFRIVDDQLVLPNGMCETICEKLFTKNSWVTVWNPFLSQRVIEGINEARDDIEIYQNKYCIWMRGKKYDWLSNEISFYFKPNPDKDMENENIFKSIYQAKETALKYVYEKEK